MLSTDESSIGVIYWAVLFFIINVTWISMDLILKRNGHEYLTTEFREGLKNPVLGPFIAGFTALTVAAFVTHMWQVQGK